MLRINDEIVQRIILRGVRQPAIFAACLVLTCAAAHSATISFDVAFVDTPTFKPTATYELKYKNGGVDSAGFTGSATQTYYGSFLLAPTDLPDGSATSPLLDIDKGFTSELVVASTPPGAPTLKFTGQTNGKLH
jgi:hypothetical protein